MITKDGKKVKRYSLIDHCNESLGCVVAREGEEIIGRVEFHGDHNEVFLEHRANGKTIRTVNVRDVSYIDFETDEAVPLLF
jgi:hypothetical protein